MFQKKENSKDAFDVFIKNCERTLISNDKIAESRVVCNATLPPLDVSRINSSASALSLVKTVLLLHPVSARLRLTPIAHEDKQRFPIIHK